MHYTNELIARSSLSRIPACAIFVKPASETPLSARGLPARARATRRTLPVNLHKNPPSAAKSTRTELRNQLVLEHLPLVKAIAVRVHQSLPAQVDLDDMVQAGILGLLDAAKKYNSEKQVVFSAYAKHRIKGAILDSLRQLDWASRDMRRRYKQLEAATLDLAAALQRVPNEAEVAGKLGMDLKCLRTMMVDLRNVGLLSASRRSSKDEDLPAPDFPDEPEGQPDWICERSELRSTLSKVVESLPERYQKIVHLYHYKEMTMKQIGGALGINESRVSQIHKSALAKLAVGLKTIGISSSQCIVSPNARALAHKA
jgi:RNA polymerase sigma factor FliA